MPQVMRHSGSGSLQPEASVFEDSSLVLDAIALLGAIMHSIKK